MDSIVEDLDPVTRLTRDLRNAARTLSDDEARFLVDAYYSMQRDRIRAAHQERTLSAGDEPHDVMSWLAGQRETLENQVRRALDAYSGAHPVGIWARSITGIGPVITAGLLANIDIKRCPTVGHIWRFGGLDPTVKWTKGTKRPWNGGLKRLLWILGESFVKVSGNDSDFYGKIYRARKELETAKNAAGDYADQAATTLADKKIGLETDARKHYEAGRLPPARIHLRAERYAVKLFLSHLHHVWWFHENKTPPPVPFILTKPGHVHFIPPPNAHLVDGLEASLAQPLLVTEPKTESAQPKKSREPTSRSAQPEATSEPKARSAKPFNKREPKDASEPLGKREPAIRSAQPTDRSEPKLKSEPKILTEPKQASTTPLVNGKPRRGRPPKARV